MCRATPGRGLGVCNQNYYNVVRSDPDHVLACVVGSKCARRNRPSFSAQRHEARFAGPNINRQRNPPPQPAEGIPYSRTTRYRPNTPGLTGANNQSRLKNSSAVQKNDGPAISVQIGSPLIDGELISALTIGPYTHTCSVSAQALFRLAPINAVRWARRNRVKVASAASIASVTLTRLSTPVRSFGGASPAPRRASGHAMRDQRDMPMSRSRLGSACGRVAGSAATRSIVGACSDVARVSIADRCDWSRLSADASWDRSSV